LISYNSFRIEGDPYPLKNKIKIKCHFKHTYVK
jgi:hypothetical protein